MLTELPNSINEEDPCMTFGSLKQLEKKKKMGFQNNFGNENEQGCIEEEKEQNN